MTFRLLKSREKRIPGYMVFTDKQMDQLVAEKPVTSGQLEKILSSFSCFNFGEGILDIITKYYV